MTSRHNVPWDNPRSSTSHQTARSARTSWPTGCAATGLDCRPRFCSKIHPDFLDSMWVPLNYRDDCHHIHGDVFPEAMFKAVREQKRVHNDGFLNYKQTVGRLRTVDRATADGLIMDSLERCGVRPSAGLRSDAHGTALSPTPATRSTSRRQPSDPGQQSDSDQRKIAIGAKQLLLLIPQSKRTTATPGRSTPALPKAQPLSPPRVLQLLRQHLRLHHRLSRTGNHRILLPTLRWHQRQLTSSIFLTGTILRQHPDTMDADVNAPQEIPRS